MTYRWVWMMVASGLWTMTLGLAIYATQSGGLSTAMWVVVAGQAACLTTGLIVLDCVLTKERARVEAIATIAAAEAAKAIGVVQPIRR